MADKKIFEFLKKGLEKARSARRVFRESEGQKIVRKPFFVSLSLRDSNEYYIDMINGGLMDKTLQPERSFHGRLEMRMGDSESGGGMGSCPFTLPMDIGSEASLHEIWFASNHAFWNCVEDYGKRKLTAMSIQNEQNKREKYSFFSREKPYKIFENEKKLEVNLDFMEHMLREVSSKLYTKRIFSSEAEFQVNNENRYLVSSEGADIFTSYRRYSITITQSAVDKDNRIVPHSACFYFLNHSEIPNLEKLLEKGEELNKELLDLIKAPIQSNDTYPILMDQDNHGVLWHEVIGHALEAHRMQDDRAEEEQFWEASKVTLFLGKINQKIAPEFISLYDDPTIAGMDGSYRFDDEGVRAQKVQLIKNGILKNYLHSRSSAGFFNTESNGHARSDNSSDPIPRMSNLLVKSTNEVSPEALEENLIKLCRKENAEYGLKLEGCSRGVTLPEECSYKTYPSRVFRVYKNGKKEQVRGIYIVGTPYHAMKNVLQTSNDYKTFRGYCGAESGWVPNTMKAPHALIRSLEVGQIPSDCYQEMKDVVIPKILSVKKK